MKKFLLVTVCVVLFAALTFAGLYTGGYLFSKWQHLPLDKSSATTLFNYWEVYSDIKEVRRSLIFSSLVAALLPVGFLLVLLLSSIPKKRELHGSAKFATLSEIEAAGLLEQSPQKPAIIVGKYKNKFLTFQGFQYALLAAPPRSGKGVGVLIPTLLTYPDSLVTFDPKLENYTITAGYRAKHGQEVFLFAPDSPTFESHRWNPLSYIRREKIYRVDDIQSIATILFSTAGADSNSAFFNENAQVLFLGLILYLLDTEGEAVNMANVVKHTTPHDGSLLSEWIKKTVTQRKSSDNPLSPECTNALLSFASNSENTAAGILASLQAPLGIFRSPMVAAATSGDDFDLREVRKKRMSIYIGIQPKNMERFSRLLNLFFQQLINENITNLPRPGIEKYQCLMLLDEFTLMGRVGIIENAIGLMPGYNMRMLLVFQSMGQLENPRVYGKEAARAIVTSCAMQIIYAPKEQEDANKYSEMIGYMTEKGMSVSTPKGLFNKSGGGSVSISEQKRALLMPQEIKDIGQGKEIIVLENVKPILADKIKYYEDPALKDRANWPLPKIPMLDMVFIEASTEGSELQTMSINEIEDGLEISNEAEILAQVNEMMGFDITNLEECEKFAQAAMNSITEEPILDGEFEPTV